MDKEFFKNFPNQMFNCDILNCFQKVYFKIAIKKKYKKCIFSNSLLVSACFNLLLNLLALIDTFVYTLNQCLNILLNMINVVV